MKKLIYETKLTDGAPIVAMSIINPNLCKQYGIEVEIEQRDEGPIPHLHVYHDRTRNPKKCSYIRLDTGEYSQHHSKTNLPLSKTQKRQFIDVMKSQWPKHMHFLPNGTAHIATGYEAAVDIWVECYENDNYSKFKLNTEGELVMPDYSKL